jgi:hypothetical protein
MDELFWTGSHYSNKWSWAARFQGLEQESLFGGCITVYLQKGME